MDGGSPKRSAETHVDITVNRNLETPYFLESQYVVDVLVDSPVDSFIIQVEAKDDDPKVS